MMLVAMLCTASQAKKVHTLGDSTMAPYDESTTVTRGWGMYFGNFLTNGWTSVNYAKGGRDSRGGYNELWQTAKKNVEAGDYVIITFAHNDEKNGGVDGVALYNYYKDKGDATAAAAVDQRGTVPSTTYKEYLGKIVDEVKALGAIPIICSPVCRSYFSGSTITRTGRHDLGDKFSVLTADGLKEGNKVDANDHSMDYAYHSQQLAAEKGVAFIDLTTATKNLYERYGDSKCHELLFDGQGSTHFNTTGAVLVARLCAQAMKEQGILANDIALPTDLTVSPADGDLGKAYSGQTLQKEFTLSGFGLTPEAGTIALSTEGNVQLSTDKAIWNNELSIGYSGGTLLQTFYARITLSQPGVTEGKVIIAQGSKTLEIPVKAEAVVLNDGEQVNAYWRLENNADFTLTGPANVVAESWKGMTVKNYANPNKATVWPEGTGFDATRKMQRNVIVGENWPADEIDDNPDRYIEFGVTAPAGMELNIDSIGFYICGAGGSGMMCHAYYSTDNFDTRTTIYAPTSMPANNPVAVEAKPVVKLAEGQSLLLRVYPWYNGAASGKTICLSDVTIHGVAKEKFVSEKVDHQAAAITFKFDDGKDGQTGTYSEGAEGWFKSNYTELGENVYYNGVSLNQSKINPSLSNEGSANDGNAINFYLIPARGLTFTPTKVSFKTTRYGTNGGKTDVTWMNSDGTPLLLEKGMQSARNNDITDYSKEVAGGKASDGLCGLRLNLYGLLDTKQVGYGDIVIEGIVNGETQDAKKCLLNVKLAEEAAGKLTVTPNGDVFDEGDEVTVSVAENFGYHFTAWTDAEGTTVSTENPYKFNIADDMNLTATFAKANTYSLNLNLTEGAQPNLVEIAPAGTMIDGKRMYEEGTEVKLTSLNNRILTFVGWEDGTTEAERTLKMDGTKNVTANYSAVDYIVGWDLYYDQPASNRAADYKTDSENAGMLSLRKADGTTQGWLTRGSSNGAENGRWGARVWKLRSEGYYFEISFSSKGYKNLHLSNGMGVSYNTYKNFDVEYSVDGKNFTKFGEFAGATELKTGWTDGEFDLPAEADEQERVYIRWKGVESSGLVGASTDYDGLCIGDIFVTADAGSMADEQALLVSSNPQEGATDVTASGSIILTFDKKIKAGQGKATLGGEQLEPIISGKTAVFKYNGLKYGTAYTFTMPAGVVTSRSGNAVAEVSLNFTTMERKQPEPRLYDAIVAADGSGDHTTLQAAIDAAPANRAKPWLIFVKNGRYKEHVDIPTTKPYMHIIGQERDKAVVLNDRLSGGDNAYNVDPGATVTVKAKNVFFENITLENEYGHEKQAGPQALALNTQGDRIVLNNVALLSYQDTWITTSTSNNRHYIKNSLIEGAVDFIYNSGNVYLDGDTLEINRPSGGYIVAPSHAADVKWGYVFQNNIIRAHKGVNVTDVWLGRPWHNSPKTVFINTQTFVNIPAKGWYEHMGGLPTLWADYNTVDAQGNPLDLSLREDTYWIEENGQRVEKKAKNYLTAEEAAQYTIKNVMGGTDGWQPEQLCEACEAPEVEVDGSQLKWQPVPYAICYVITCGDEVMGFTTETSYPGEKGWKVQAVNEYGGLSLAGIAGISNGIKATTQLETTTQPKAIYSAEGRRLQQLGKGLNIVRRADGSVVKIIR